MLKTVMATKKTSVMATKKTSVMATKKTRHGDKKNSVMETKKTASWRQKKQNWFFLSPCVFFVSTPARGIYL